MVLGMHSFLYKNHVNLVQLHKCLGYTKFEPQSMLRICSRKQYANNFPLTFFNFSFHARSCFEDSNLYLNVLV